MLTQDLLRSEILRDLRLLKNLKINFVLMDILEGFSHLEIVPTERQFYYLISYFVYSDLTPI